jgi:hypothetical protein
VKKEKKYRRKKTKKKKKEKNALEFVVKDAWLDCDLGQTKCQM